MNRFASVGIVLLLLAGWSASQETAPTAQRIPKGKFDEKVAERIDFTFTLLGEDPFSKSNVAGAPPVFRRGEVVKLVVGGTPRPGFYTYSFTQRAEKQKDYPPGVGKLTIGETAGVQPLWPIQESPPPVLKEDVLSHLGPFTLTQDLLILPDAAPGPRTLLIELHLMVCKTDCLPGKLYYEVPITVSEAPAEPLTAALKERLTAQEPPVRLVGETKAKTPVAEKTPAKTDAPKAETPKEASGSGVNASLIAFILTGIFWGAVSLITPCVFPMIPITVSFFLKQSEKEHHQPVKMALVYCATIIVVLTIAAVGLLSFFQELSVSPLMNFGIGALFIFFALSLFGMYEIELPSSVARFTSSREGQGGLAGTIFMALTFTVISFACVAPFLGGFGGTAATHRFTLFERILGGLAFSITFASPFFLLATFPVLLHKLPKSGSWLNSVKVVMGFLELAAAVKFLRAGELIFLPRPLIFTYDFCLGLYVAISVLTGLYLLNVYLLPHDTPTEHIGVPRLMLGMLFLTLAVYLMPGLIKNSVTGENQRPQGIIFAWVSSFLLPDRSEAPPFTWFGPGKGSEGHGLPWTGNLKQGLEDALQNGKLVFIDFTGETCQNCSLNEQNVFPKPAVSDLLRQYQLVQLYTDKVPNHLYPPSEQAELERGTARQRADAAANRQLQADRFDDIRLPLYVIVEPLPGGDFKEIARYDEGLINDEAAFIRFLQKPLSK